MKIFHTRNKNSFQHFNKGLAQECFQKILIILVSVLTIYSIVQAGSLVPSASPAATGYTLNDIYTRLTTNATSTEGGHSFSPEGVPSGTFHTLTEIYNAIPTIIPSTVKLGTSYLGVVGTLTPDGGTASTADLFSGKTAYLNDDWVLDIGTLNLACNTSTFDGVANLVPDVYDGEGNGTNRWCITESGNATAGDILSGKTAWVDGQLITGTIATQLLSNTSTTVNAGYYNSTTLDSVDTDLAAENIKSGINLFGITGTLSPGGTATAEDVCNGATFYSGDSWVQKIGNRTACQSCASGTASASDIVINKTADIDCDGAVETGTLEMHVSGDPVATICIDTYRNHDYYNRCSAGETCESVCADWGLTCVHTLYSNLVAMLCLFPSNVSVGDCSSTYPCDFSYNTACLCQ